MLTLASLLGYSHISLTDESVVFCTAFSFVNMFVIVNYIYYLVVSNREI